MELLILTGACGVGKTTTAKEWAKLKNGAIIECDYLTEWIFKKDFPQWSAVEEKFVADTSALMALEYMKYDMPVAIENVWSPTGIKIILDKINSSRKDVKCKVAWLKCNLPENHRRDELRIKENQMLERVDVVNGELKSYDWPGYVMKLDTSEITVQQTIETIESSGLMYQE